MPDREPRERDRHHEGAGRRRAAQQAEASRPDMQDVLGEHRQQGGRAAQQHREQIQGDRAEHQPVAAHIGEAVEHLHPGIARRARLGAGDRADQAQHQQPEQEQAERYGIGQPVVRGVEVAAHRRPEHRSRLPRDRTHRDRGRQHGGGHQIGRERLQRRPCERARDAEQRGHEEQPRQRDRARPGQPGEQPRAHGFQRHRPARDPAPVDAIRHPAGDQRQDQQRQELRDADQPELKRRRLHRHGAACDVVHLPADHHHHRDLRQRVGQPRQEIGAEIVDRERMGGGAAHRNTQVGAGSCGGNGRTAWGRCGSGFGRGKRARWLRRLPGWARARVGRRMKVRAPVERRHRQAQEDV